MDTEAERMRILEMIESGRITAAEGLLLLEALNDDDTGELSLDEALPEAPLPEPLPLPGRLELREPLAANQDAYFAAEDEAAPEIIVDGGTPPAGLPAEAAHWKRYWTVPLWIGVGLTVLGGLLMYAAIRPDGSLSLWMLCAAVPFMLGVLVLALAWAGRHAPWLHLRVQQAPGATPQRIAFSIPLPIRPAVWFLRTFGRNIPNVRDQQLDEMILAVGRSATPENPIYIQVDEGQRGEKVEIYIG